VKSLYPLPLLAAALLGVGAASISDAPVKNFVLKIFAKDGALSHVVRGSAARYLGPDLIEITDMNIAVFPITGGTTAETVLLSPQANFLPNTNQAKGEKGVRFIRDDVEAWGTKWVYDQKAKRISLDEKVRVVFHAELKDILK